MGTVTVLRPHLAFDREETLLSFANRLALMHTGREMEQLLRDLGIKIPDFVFGRAEAVAALATAVGASSDALLANAIDMRQTFVLFRGERLSKKFLSPRAARFCPACLEEDGANESWRHRLIWGVRHVHRCCRHELWLESSSDPAAISLSSAAWPSDTVTRRPVSEPEPDYLNWLAARLHGNLAMGDSWLEDQTIEQILCKSRSS